MPSKLTEKQQERRKELAVAKKKYKHWGPREEKLIKDQFKLVVDAELERTRNTPIPVTLVTDFQSAAQQCLYARYLIYIIHLYLFNIE